MDFNSLEVGDTVYIVMETSVDNTRDECATVTNIEETEISVETTRTDGPLFTVHKSGTIDLISPNKSSVVVESFGSVQSISKSGP